MPDYFSKPCPEYLFRRVADDAMDASAAYNFHFRFVAVMPSTRRFKPSSPRNG